MEWKFAELEKGFETDANAEVAGIYADLLERGSVARVDVAEDARYWGIFGHEEVRAAADDVETFSSIVPLRGARILPLQADPREHASVRRLLNLYFKPPAIKAKEPVIRRFAGEMIDAIAGKGHADAGQELAYPLPTRVLVDFIGIPDRDWRIHHDFIMELEARTHHGLNSPDESIIPPDEGLVVYLMTLIAERRAHPGDDPISDILRQELNGAPVTDLDAMQLCIAILMAGHITTSSATGNLVLRLARDQELQAYLRANPGRIREAVEESLRIDAPQQAMQRRCAKDTVIGGQPIKAGEPVLLNFGSANVDPARFPDPDRFDIDRADKRHMAFGRGIHQCVGAPLARLELQIVAEELLARTRSFALAGEVKRLAWPRLSVEHLPLRIEPA